MGGPSGLKNLRHQVECAAAADPLITDDSMTPGRKSGWRTLMTMAILVGRNNTVIEVISPCA